MANNNSFLQAWFKGFSASLDLISTAERQKVFAQCGKACSEYSTKELYTNSWAESDGNLSKCVRLIQEQLAPDVLYEPVDEAGIPANKCFDVVYSHCACPLVAENFMSSPVLCECSRQKLLHNWESVVGKGNVGVETKQTIIGGSSTCVMRVTFR